MLCVCVCEREREYEQIYEVVNRANLPVAFITSMALFPYIKMKVCTHKTYIQD